VQARNDQVVEGLQSAYAAKVPGGSLSVFCVSNETYKKFTRKGNLDMIQASGIPALRSFCYSITAQSQLLESKFFLTSRLGGLLNSLQIWVECCQQDLAGRSVRSSKSAGDYLAEIETEVRDSSHFCKELTDVRFRAYSSAPRMDLKRPSKTSCSNIPVSENAIFCV
jgi:hypothetical protein